MKRLLVRQLARRCLKWALLIGATTVLVGTAVGFVLIHVLPFPSARLEQWPASPQVTDRSGRLMLTVVAADEHWRYPIALDEVSPRLIQATIAVEDERFHVHPGIDPVAVARAIGQNIRARRIVSGASTLSMQVCRMMDDRPRTWRAKAVESFRALQLETRHTKDEILALYLNLAPYGGNLRGVEAAARAYFNKHAADLSLGEAALLAGLPQAPSRYRPDRNPETAAARRLTVLRRMVDAGMITPEQSRLAAEEPVDVPPAPRRQMGRHAAWLALAQSPMGGRTTIDGRLQVQVEGLVDEHVRILPPRSQVAVVVIDTERAEIVALVGSADFDAPVDGQVNGAIAPRSPGSALKPFIYAAAFEAGRLAPHWTVYDVPVIRAGWQPRNFDDTYSGEISVEQALRRSLNIPAVLVAEGVGVARCAGVIESAGVRLSDGAATRSGLALAVGGSEVTLLDLTNAYATLGRGGRRRPVSLLRDAPNREASVLAPNVCGAIDDILSSHRRRPRGMADMAPGDVPWFMWKTGTSSRRRDAWAVGHNRRFAIGVWVGRFSGAGSTEFVGAEAAEPLLARLFDLDLIRVAEAPAPATPWIPERPLPRPPETASALSIISPNDGAVFIATGRTAMIHPRSNREAGATWFLDGRRLTGDEASRIAVGPGSHELRCVGDEGTSAAVRFTVQSAGRQ